MEAEGRDIFWLDAVLPEYLVLDPALRLTVVDILSYKAVPRPWSAARSAPGC